MGREVDRGPWAVGRGPPGRGPAFSKTLGEEPLFVENISVTYDVDSLVISNVEHA